MGIFFDERGLSVSKPPWECDRPKGLPDMTDTARLAELGLMAGALVHELRQPLMGIRGYAQIIAEKGSAELREKAELIVKQVTRLEELVERYRRFARADPGEMKPVDMAEVAREALKVAEPRTRAAGVEVVVQIPEGMLPVNGLEGQLVQVLVNLLVNACDALADRSDRAVLVAARGDAAWVSLFVADRGPGIPADAGDKVFMPLYTTKAKHAGTGLGLYVSRAIAATHGGSLELVAADAITWSPPAATVFRMRLPVLGSQAPGRRTVLVVDDEEIVRTLMRDLLVPDGLDVTLAATGDEGLRLVAERRYDLIVVDKNLPGPNGLELARKARAKHPECGVILITAYPSLESAQEALDLGIVDYLEKPFPDISQVRAKVREVIEASRERASPRATPAPQPSRRVLVVEDNDDLGATLLEAVAIAGGVPVRARSIAEAAKLGAEAPLAGVILSLDLRDAALGPKAIRDLKGPTGVPLVALCDRPSFEGTIAAIRMGAQACLPRALAAPRALATELGRFFKLG